MSLYEHSAQHNTRIKIQAERFYNTLNNQGYSMSNRYEKGNFQKIMTQFEEQFYKEQRKEPAQTQTSYQPKNDYQVSDYFKQYMQQQYFPHTVEKPQHPDFKEPFQFDQNSQQQAVYVKPIQPTIMNILPAEKNYIDLHANSKHYFPETKRGQSNQKPLFMPKPSQDQTNIKFAELSKQNEALKPVQKEKVPLQVQFMNMYGLGENLNELSRDANIKKHIDFLGGVQKTLPKMKTDLLENELRNFSGNLGKAEINLLETQKVHQNEISAPFKVNENVQMSYVSPYRNEPSPLKENQFFQRSKEERQHREKLLKRRFLQMDQLDIKK